MTGRENRPNRAETSSKKGGGKGKRFNLYYIQFFVEKGQGKGGKCHVEVEPKLKCERRLESLAPAGSLFRGGQFSSFIFFAPQLATCFWRCKWVYISWRDGMNAACFSSSILLINHNIYVRVVWPGSCE